MNSKDKKKIIAVVGMPGSGKSTVVQKFVSSYELPYIYFGGFTLQEVRNQGLPETPENEKKVRHELRERYGMGAYAHLALPEIKKMLEMNDHILLDGLYSWSEYILLKEAAVAEVILLVVISKRRTRYHRLATREVRPLTTEQAEERDFAEIVHLEKGGPIALCDYYIVNDGTLEQMDQAVHSVAQEIGCKKKK